MHHSGIALAHRHGSIRHIFARVELDLFSTLGETEVLDERVEVTDDDQFDYLLGINFNHWISDKWGLMLNADLGVAGDNDRDYGFDVRALYRISDLNNLWFGWRRLTIGNDAIVDGKDWKVDMTQSGPTLGWAFTFR